MGVFGRAFNRIMDFLVGSPDQKSLENSLRDFLESRKLLQARINNLKRELDPSYMNLMKLRIEELREQRKSKKLDSLAVRNYDIAIAIAETNERLLTVIEQMEDVKASMRANNFNIPAWAN